MIRDWMMRLLILAVVLGVMSATLLISTTATVYALLILNAIPMVLSGWVWTTHTAEATRAAVVHFQITDAQVHYPGLVMFVTSFGIVAAYSRREFVGFSDDWWFTFLYCTGPILLSIPFLHNLIAGRYRLELWQI